MSAAVSGVSGASPIWNRIIKEALNNSEEGKYNEEDEGHAWPRQPEDVVGANVCTDTGNIATDGEAGGCQSRFEYFLKGAVGSRVESGITDIQIDKTTGQQADPQLPPELIETQAHPFVLDPLGTLVCLDCPIASFSATLKYPL